MLSTLVLRNNSLGSFVFLALKKQDCLKVKVKDGQCNIVSDTDGCKRTPTVSIAN